jgi:acetyltransferase-like isoleucine patch superfamily enzyme
VVLRPVIIDDYAWIASDVVLYNCHIGEGAVVSVGSVVRSRDVPPWTMVEGNPARIIARYEGGEWIYLDEPEPLPMTAGWKGKTE